MVSFINKEFRHKKFLIFHVIGFLLEMRLKKNLRDIARTISLK